ncbi:hypothetical protein, partial [Klebsiella pneumoniae]|uniref:hypothetical protein n=1 Tax=Klebsiella pneumoniae TaxID=573 RepID=UPI001D93B723
TETEATGAPQKHHYTLNQQVGSITIHLAKIPAISPKMIQERIPMVNRPLVTFKHLVLKRVA